MNKKIMLLALAAVSAVVLALPAMASASEPLHLNPTPSGPQPLHGGVSSLSTAGSTITCKSVSGNLVFEAGGTTGNIPAGLTFKECSTFGGFVSCKSSEPEDGAGNIQTTPLSFHLVTLPNSKPGVLMTGTNEVFAHLNCGGILFTVDGKGVIGTLTQACGTTASSTGVNFEKNAAGQQEHMLLAGTPNTKYDLTRSNGETAAQEATGTVTLTQASKLECT